MIQFYISLVIFYRYQVLAHSITPNTMCWGKHGISQMGKFYLLLYTILQLLILFNRTSSQCYFFSFLFSLCFYLFSKFIISYEYAKNIYKQPTPLQLVDIFYTHTQQENNFLKQFSIITMFKTPLHHQPSFFLFAPYTISNFYYNHFWQVCILVVFNVVAHSIVYFSNAFQ